MPEVLAHSSPHEPAVRPSLLHSFIKLSGMSSSLYACQKPLTWVANVTGHQLFSKSLIGLQRHYLITFDDMQGPELNEEQREQEAQWGPPRGDPTQWSSCLRVVDPSTLETASVIELDNNEAAISMCCVCFTGAEDYLLAVGTVQSLGFYPRAADGTVLA